MQINWEFGDYAESYRSAAKQLAATLSGEPGLASQLSLPTLFLYRHALELAIKDAYVWTEMSISQGSVLPSKPGDEVINEIQGHALQGLLDRLEHRFRMLDPTSEPLKPDGLAQAVRPAVAALDAFDVDGQRFRYPYLSRGRGRSWSRDRQGPSSDNLTSVANDVEAGLNHLLDVMGPWFSDVLDQQFEAAWLEQLWKAEERALRLETIYRSGVHGDSDLVDDLKSELSAEMLLHDDV